MTLVSDMPSKHSLSSIQVRFYFIYLQFLERICIQLPPDGHLLNEEMSIT